MSPTKIGSAIFNIRRHMLLQAIRPPRSNNGFLGGCFTSVSNPPPQGAKEAVISVGEKAKQRVDSAWGKAKETGQKIKDKLMGKATGNVNGSSGGVQHTDSSVEDLRNRPSGYS